MIDCCPATDHAFVKDESKYLFWLSVRDNLKKNPDAVVARDAKAPMGGSLLGDCPAYPSVSVEVDTIDWRASDLLLAVECISRYIGGLVEGNRDEEGQGSSPVLVFMDTSVMYVACCLAALASNRAFVPIHSRWTDEFIHRIVSMCGGQTVLWAETQEDVPGGVGAPPATLGVPLTKVEAMVGNRANGAALNFEFVCTGGSFGSRGVTRSILKPNTAYVLCTSGTNSAGPLKCVEGTVQGLVNRIRWMEQKYPFQPGDLVCYQTPSCFVDHVWQWAAPLYTQSGVPFCAIPLSIYLDHNRLVQVMKSIKPSHVVTTPTVWSLLALHRERMGTLRIAVSSGEVLHLCVLRWIRLVIPPSCIVLNLYGSTETSADSTCYECDEKELHGQDLDGFTAIPIGQPITSTAIFLDVVDGTVQGKDIYKIIICGDGVCNGYYDVESPNFESKCWSTLCQKYQLFHENDSRPLLRNKTKSMKIFHTNDLGTIRKDGNLVVLGRADDNDSVGKESCVLVDLPVHSAIIGSSDAIEQHIFYLYNSVRDSFVIAFVKWKANPDVDSLVKHCNQMLPFGLPPIDYVFAMEDFPFTYSNKLNVLVVSSMIQNWDNARNTSRESRSVHKRSKSILTEGRIFKTFSEILDVGAFEPNDSLFDLGATSKLIVRISDALNVPVELVYRFPSVRKLHKAIMSDGKRAAPRSEVMPLLPIGASKKARQVINMSKCVVSKPIWSADLGSCIDAKALLCQDIVMSASHKGVVGCFDRFSGKNVWLKKVDGTIDGAMKIIDENIWIPTADSMVSLSLASGAIIHKVESLSLGARIGMESDKRGALWLGTHNKNVIAIDSCTGMHHFSKGGKTSEYSCSY